MRAVGAGKLIANLVNAKASWHAKMYQTDVEIHFAAKTAQSIKPLGGRVWECVSLYIALLFVDIKQTN